jgi:hypothetical protein
MRRALPLVRLQCRWIAERLLTPFARDLCNTRVLLYLMLLEELLSRKSAYACPTERVYIRYMVGIKYVIVELCSALLATVGMDTLFVIL